MAEPNVIGMLLPGEDILSLLETPPRQIVHDPATPVKQDLPAARPSSAGHTPKTALRTRPTSSPGRLTTSLSVSFLADPVSGTFRYDAGRSVNKTPESSPFNPIACFRSPEEERGERPTLPSKPVWNLLPTARPRTTVSEEPLGASEASTEIEEANTVLHSSPYPRTASSLSASRRQSMAVRSQSAQSLGRRTAPPTRLSHAPPHSSPFEPATNTRRQSSDKGVQSIDSTLAQDRVPPFQPPSRRQGFLQRAQNITRSKIFGISGAGAPNHKYGYDTTANGGCGGVAPYNSLPHDLDLDTMFRIVEGCITFDREIKALFQENGGLRRIWKEEAVPLFKRGNKAGFDVKVKRLEMAMTGLAGRTVVFS